MSKKVAKPKGKYKSTFEYNVANDAQYRKLKILYESIKLRYCVPETWRNYIPDFILPNGILVECKGRFTLADRKKMLMVRKSNPNVDIRLLFQNSSVKLMKGSKTTYGMWASKNGFIWAEGTSIPEEWVT